VCANAFSKNLTGLPSIFQTKIFDFVSKAMDAMKNPRKSYPAIFVSQVENFLKAYNNKKMLSVYM
jgi:hypothetical protein